MELYLLQYNNYYNRIVKKFDTLQDYLPFVIGEPLQRVNFNPNDGVDTKQIINWELGIPDYVIVANGNEILSRWFVMEATRTRGGQYELILHRDLIVDNYEDVVNAPCFIEKATVNAGNPLIYNSEGMTFNQIKKSETLLKDKSDCAWIVGYFARTKGKEKDTDPDIITDLKGQVNTYTLPDFIVNGPLTDWEYYGLLSQKFTIPTNYEWVMEWENADKTDGGIVKLFLNNKEIVYYDVRHGGLVPSGKTLNKKNFSRVLRKYQNELDSIVRPLGGYTDNDTLIKVGNLTGKIVQYVENGEKKYARIVRSNNQVRYFKQIINNEMGSLTATTSKILVEGLITWPYYDNPSTAPYVEGYGNEFSISAEPLQASGYEYNIPQNRVHIGDAPYDIFCIPYGDITITLADGSIMKPDKDLMLNIATDMTERHGALIYDLQLLPYCPVQGLITTKGHMDLFGLNGPNGPDPAEYSFITLKGQSANTKVGVMFLPTYSAFTFNIPLANPIRITEPKIQCETELYRLLSPSGNGGFDFNAAKNNGIDYFNVDCTYIPFSPYIHINPNFKNMYGQDFNDTRGLICGGDFSLTRVNDAWTQYKLTNKNYQAMFDRQLDSMDKQHKAATISDIANIVGGAAVASGAGVVMGSNFGTGGTIGMGVGAGVASTIAGAVDTRMNIELRKEQRDLAVANFTYTKGNISATPDTLAKTTAFTFNNKLFPILEFYSATEQEKQLLRNKIKYDGMTVMAIGTIADYQQEKPSYIKGQIIRLENIPDDYHCLITIADEVNKGLFI